MYKTCEFSLQFVSKLYKYFVRMYIQAKKGNAPTDLSFYFVFIRKRIQIENLAQN